jgi:protein MBA1
LDFEGVEKDRRRPEGNMQDEAAVQLNSQVPHLGGSRDSSRISHRRKKSPYFKASRNRLDLQPNFTMATSIAGAPLFSATRARAAVFSPSSTLALSQCRQFSLSAQCSALQRGMPQTLSVKQPSQPSMKSRGQNMSRFELPQDIGLLPGTYIRPLWRDMPSIFQQPRERLHFEWLWVKSWFQNFLG